MKVSFEYWPIQAMASSDNQADTKPDVSSSQLPQTLAQVYDAHFDFVWRNVRRLGVSAASADDVAQDVFMIVQRRISDYDGRSPMRSWLFGILVRVVSGHRRSMRRKSSRHVPLELEVHQDLNDAGELSPAEQLERAQRVRLVERLLDELDEEKRALLILFELEEWTLREIAEFYGSNINTIYSRLRAAKREFERAYQRSQLRKEEAP